MIATAPGWQRLPVEGVETWAFGYTRGQAHRNPWIDFPGCATDALVLLHGSCLAAGLAADGGYFPFTPAEIPPCGYLALGHHHRPVQMQRFPLAIYAGSPEPFAPEVTPACVYSVTMNGADVSAEPIDVATRRHRLTRVDVTGQTAAYIWDQALASAGVNDVLCLQLAGMLAAEESLDLAALRAELSARCFAVDVDTRELLLPPEHSTDGVAGALYALVAARQSALPTDDPVQTRLAHAFRYAALALEGKL